MSASGDFSAADAALSPGASENGRSRSPVRHALEHGLFRLSVGTLALLPRGSARRLGSWAARAFFAGARGRRRILLQNLTAAFPEKSSGEISRLARQCIESFGATAMEFLDSPSLSRQDILERVELAGEENFAAARARGKGVFLLSAHFGSWELGAVRAGMIAGPIAPVVRPLDNPRLEAELAARRTRFGNRLISKREAAREILRAIRRNETVAILIDQNVQTHEAVFVPFFGRLAATNPSLALLQMKTDAAVVPVFTRPVAPGRYRLEFEPPILASDFAGLPREERVRRATARYMEVTEKMVRGQPAAWLWMHNRWRTRPEEG
jgi:Kdo2-lipid IVA lauroyltransferase/acyltransferase